MSVNPSTSSVKEIIASNCQSSLSVKAPTQSDCHPKPAEGQSTSLPITQQPKMLGSLFNL